MIFSDAEQPWLTHSDKEKISLIICMFFVMEHQGEEGKGWPSMALAPSGLFDLLRTQSQGGQTAGPGVEAAVTGSETTVVIT